MAFRARRFVDDSASREGSASTCCCRSGCPSGSTFFWNGFSGFGKCERDARSQSIRLPRRGLAGTLGVHFRGMGVFRQLTTANVKQPGNPPAFKTTVSPRARSKAAVALLLIHAADHQGAKAAWQARMAM